MVDRINSAELLEALFDGVSETPLWGTFLDRLARATGADSAILLFSPPGRRLDEALVLSSGDVPLAVLQDYLQKLPAYVQHSSRRPLVEGRPYSLEQLFGSDDSADAVFYRDYLRRNGINAIRQLRVREASGVDALLTISSRGKKEFSQRENALLSAIAPTLRGVMQLYIRMERERFAASLNAETVRRLQFGWLALDAAGQVLDSDEQGASVLSGSGVLGISAIGQLTARSAKLERQIFNALNRVTRSIESRPRAIVLRRDPWLDMLLVPTRRNLLTTKPAPAAIAYVHGDSWRSTERCEQLAELFALSPREARMALALSRGMTIAEAASKFGLTIATARTYSKLIYKKTGARGLPDLVRIVMRSILAIAP